MALDIKISFSWINYCRLCLQDKGLKIPIFAKEGITENISVKIQECLNITTYDGDPLPRMICHECLCKLNTAYELHQKALESFRLLLTHLQPLKHVPSVQEYMKDCNVSVGDDESNKEAPEEPIVKPSTPRGKSGQFIKATNHEAAPDSEEAVDSGRGRVTRSRVNARSSLGSQDGGTSSQKGSITIVPDIENPSLTSSMTEPPSPSTASSKEPGFLVPPPPKPRGDNHNHLNADHIDHDSSDDLSKRKRKRITDYYDEALMDTGGNLVLAAGRTRESRHRDSKRKKIGPASRTRALATCLSGPSPWQCVMCACFFASHNMLRRHLSNCLICQTCGLEFSSAKDKALHEQDHMYVNLNKYVDLLYKCDHCERAFAAHLMLKQHIKYDHSDSSEHLYSVTQPSPYIDPDSAEDEDDAEDVDSCKCESDEEKKCDEANSVDERTVEKKEVCPKCSRPFANKQRLMYHLLGHDNLFKCSFCPWMFPMGPGRRRHMRRLHGDKGDPICFTCSVCRETFETKAILYLHKKGHGKGEVADDTGKPEGSSKKVDLEHCHVCDRMIQPSKFMSHLMQHANDAYDGKQQAEETPKEPDMQLQCQLCPVVSATPEQHRAHVAQKHVQPKSINFTCDGCSQTFANVEAINRHSCPGKETNEQWKNCEHCGQNLSEGKNHVCDNKCPICHKIFKSSRGQRLHLQHKHENPESVPVNDSSDTRSSDPGEVPEAGAFENVAVKEERAADEMIEENNDPVPLGDETEELPDCSLPSGETVAELPTTTSHAVSDEPSSSTSPNLPTGTPLSRQNTGSHPDKSATGKGTPKIRLKPSESLISEPPPLFTLTKAQSAATKDQGYMKTPPPPYRPPLTATETKFTKSIILRKNTGSVQSYSMVVANVGSSTNSLTPLSEAGSNASNSQSDHSYTSNFSPSSVSPALPTTLQSSTFPPVAGAPVSSVSNVSPNFVTTVGRPVFIPSSNSSQIVSTKIMSTSLATRIVRPTVGLNVPSTPSVIINPKTEHIETRPTLPVPPTHVVKETQPVNQSHIRCVQISSLQGVPTSSSATFLPVSNQTNPAPILTNQSNVATFSQMSSNQSHVTTFSQVSTNQSNVGLGYSSNMYNRVPRVPNPLFTRFQPASGAGGTEENLLRDVLLGRRIRDEDPV